MMDEHYSDQRDEDDRRREEAHQKRTKMLPPQMREPNLDRVRVVGLRDDVEVILTVQPKNYPNGGSIKDWKKWLAALSEEFGAEVRVQIHKPEGPTRKRRKS